MSQSRRSLLVAGTASLSLLFVGGVAWRASSKGVLGIGESEAYEPWRNWASEPLEGPLAAVRAGVLAASAHNTQPWLFEVAADQIAVHADFSRHLGSFDPFHRELHLSVGCALANMELAANAAGLGGTIATLSGRLDDPSVTVDPDAGAAAKSETAVRPVSMEGMPVPVAMRAVARLYLTEVPPSRSPLVDVIDARHTNRRAYDGEIMVPEYVKAAMQTEVGRGLPPLRLFLFEPGDGKFGRLGNLIVQATEAITADSAMSADSARWFRFDRTQVLTHRDGVTLEAAGLPTLATALAKLMPDPDPADAEREWLRATRETHVGTAPLLGMIAVGDLYDMPNTIAAGRLWQRLHLLLTANGIAAQPLNQPVEIVDRQRALGREPVMANALAELIVLAEADEAEAATVAGTEAATTGIVWQPTLVFRAGYAERGAVASPRRPLDAVLLG
ncbi:MAG: hypothetical protein WD044_16290 [Dongiaceae bacterium]